MRTDIIEYLRKEVRARCEKSENRFGIGCYYHIKAVAANAELLSEKYGADKETVTIAAWLHDIASITDYSLYENHHIHGAEMAADILNSLDYDKKKIPLVQSCIRNHRGSIKSERLSAEELCVADADAVSHFDNVPSLLYLAFVTKGMGFEDGKKFVAEKLERSFSKLSEKGRVFYGEKYRRVMEMLGS